MRTPVVVTPHKALQKYAEHRKFLNETKMRMELHKKDVEFRKQNQEPTVHHYLVAKGMNADYSTRKMLAKQLGMKNYLGTKKENENLLKVMQMRDSYDESHPQKENNPLEEYLRLSDAS